MPVPPALVDALATLTLGPLLLAQGRWVRRVTPRLPEAAGPRQGQAGLGPPLSLLVTGDSSAAGVGAATQQQALAGQLAQRLAPRWRVAWSVVARTGLDTRGLAQWLAQAAPQRHDVAVVCTGVNDVTGRVHPDDFAAQLEGLVGTLRGRHGVRLTVLSPVPPMQHFTALPQPLRAYLGWQSRRLDAALRLHAPRWPGCALLPAPLPVHPGAIASDGFHPSERTYAAWADAVAATIEAAHPPGRAAPGAPAPCP
jgi:lysophospholipase L1-like esterase